MQGVENVMKRKMLSATVKTAFLKMFSTMYLNVFSHVSLVLLTLGCFFCSQNLFQGHSIMVRFLITKALLHY